MDNLARGSLKIAAVLGLLAVFAFTACEKKSRNSGRGGGTITSNPRNPSNPGDSGGIEVHNSGGGTLDGGGGDPIFATRDSVVSTVNEVWALLTAFKATNPLFLAFQKAESIADNDNPVIARATDEEVKIEKRALEMLNKILGKPNGGTFLSAGTAERTTLDESPVFGIKKQFDVVQLASKKIEFLEKGFCRPTGDHKGTWASVSKLQLDGEVCISVEALQRSASASLRHDVVALLSHEIAHLYGYQEDDAVFLQKYLLDNIKYVMRIDGRTTTFKIWEAVNEPFASLRRWHKLVRYDQIDMAYIFDITRYHGRYSTLITTLPEAGGDDLTLKRPELEKEAMNIFRNVRDALENLEKGFRQDNPEGRPKPVDEAALGYIRQALLSMTEARLTVTRYMNGAQQNPLREKFIAREMELRRNIIIKATEPATLKDPSLRPDLEQFEEDLFQEFMRMREEAKKNRAAVERP